MTKTEFFQLLKDLDDILAKLTLEPANPMHTFALAELIYSLILTLEPKE